MVGEQEKLACLLFLGPRGMDGGLAYLRKNWVNAIPDVGGLDGKQGVEVVQQALAQGHDVTALVRDPDKMAGLVPNKELKIQKIDFSSADTVEPHLQDKDVVLSCRTWPWSVTLYTDSMEVIVAAMKKNKVKRLVCVTSWFTTDDPSNPPSFMMRWIVKPLFLGRIMYNMSQMEQYLQGCEDINFTAVRPPGLRMGPVTDMEFRTEEGPQVCDRDGVRGMCRADVARFMLSTMTSEDWVRKCVAVIAVPKK
ncbi:BLVRB [Branchiostoma lanceolatum]|uniref:BLVRB protein n=1 Tax=Branchiostoma lanceolatum TaxID=7740 RepID=A0A8J9VX97_BRALA|nr:BLVRB [Branchiostoma lanceolatum]